MHRSASDAASTPQMAQIALPDAAPHGRDMAHISSFQMQARGIDGTNHFDRRKLHGTDGTDHLPRCKLAAQMAQITLPDKQPRRRWHRSISSSQHRWHRSTCTTEARDTDGTGHLFRRKLAAQMAYIALLDTSFTPHNGTDHLARHKLHDTDGTDRLGRRNVTAQMPQIIPSITAQMHPSRRKLHGTDRSLFQTQARGTDRTDHPQTHASRDRSPCQTEASRHRWIRSFSKSQVPRCIWHGSSAVVLKR